MNISKYILFMFPLLFIILFIFICTNSTSDFITLVKEDGLVEYAQAIFYFLSGIFALITGIKLRQAKFPKLLSFSYFLFSLFLLFVALEEISWGQRLIGIKTPSIIQEHNVQGELTVHNLKPFQAILHTAYILVGFYGTFAHIIFPKIFSKQPRHHLSYFLAPPFLIFYFLPISLYYLSYDFIYLRSQPLMRQAPNYANWQEVFEFNLALAFLIFVYQKYKVTQSQKIR